MESSNRRLLTAAGLIVLFDQATKWLVEQYLPMMREYVVFDGFFKLVHWGNTGAAWSLFREQNNVLAVVSFLALLVLFFGRRHFDSGTRVGQISLGLLAGGILGNLIDRVHQDRQHVIDFLRFYVNQRGGSEIGFPAFNVADSAICIGVALLFFLSWKQGPGMNPAVDDPA